MNWDRQVLYSRKKLYKFVDRRKSFDKKIDKTTYFVKFVSDALRDATRPSEETAKGIVVRIYEGSGNRFVIELGNREIWLNVKRNKHYFSLNQMVGRFNLKYFDSRETEEEAIVQAKRVVKAFEEFA